MSKVSIVRMKNNNVKEAVYRSLDLLQIEFNEKIKDVLIKPNLCHYFSSDTGITTDPRVVASIIDYIREKVNTAAKITIAEADATEMKTEIAFKVLGYEKLAEEKNVRLLNLSEDKKLKVDGKFVKEIPQIIRESDLFISVPKLKTHMDVKISICLKNQYGAIPYWRKNIFHKHLEETIIEASKFMKPHLCVVDGLIALEGIGPISQGSPVIMNLIVGGNDPVATDYVCSQIMCFPNVKYVMMGERQGIGSTRHIQILGEKIEDVKRKFRFYTFEEYIRKYGYNYSKKIFNVIGLKSKSAQVHQA